MTVHDVEEGQEVPRNVHQETDYLPGVVEVLPKVMNEYREDHNPRRERDKEQKELHLVLTLLPSRMNIIFVKIRHRIGKLD
jgi:hypothetical protein